MKHQKLPGFFDVKHFGVKLPPGISPRRQAITPIVGMDRQEAFDLAKIQLPIAGLEEYLPCWTVEMRKRQIPFVSTDSKPLRVLEKFKKYFPSLLSFLLSVAKPTCQTYRKESRIGHPIHDFAPKEKTKREFLEPFFAALVAGDDSALADGRTDTGPRLQAEVPTKLRELQFIDDGGDVYQEEVDRRNYKEHVPELGLMVPPRSRGIFSPAICNLLMQNVDSLLLHSLLQFPICHFNLYTQETWDTSGYFLSFDCKHHERVIGMIAQPYADMIGGKYAKWMAMMLAMPFLVPSDTWKNFFLIYPRYGPGRYPQFPSGFCNVATLGKFAPICVYIAYHVEVLKYSVSDAIAAVLNGTGPVRIRNNGDDNMFQGEKSAVMAIYKYTADYFATEVDETPTINGFVMNFAMKRMLLRTSTYLIKDFYRERNFDWKEYTDKLHPENNRLGFPNLGRMLRRENFEKYGDPEIQKYAAIEDEYRQELGCPWSDVIMASAKEREIANRAGVKIYKEDVTDKDYLLTEKERAERDPRNSLTEAQNLAYVRAIVGEQFNKQLKIAA